MSETMTNCVVFWNLILLNFIMALFFSAKTVVTKTHNLYKKTGSLQTKAKFSLRNIMKTCPCPDGEQPKFCVIIADQEADNLTIPQEFARRHGHDLPDNVFLKVPPSCKLWDVAVVKSGGEILLKNGWEDFKEHYFVKFGDFMVFAYGGSVFEVFIYDMTCTSIDYSSSDDDSDEETESESLGKISKPQKGKQKINDRCSCSTKVPKKKRGEAYRKAAAFKATIQQAVPSFIVVMGQSNTSRQYCLNIPVLMARELLSKKFNEIKLHVLEGGTYFAKCSLKEAKARITSGWKELVLDNELKPGDCCVIQVNKKDMLEWYVTIFKC